MEFDYNLRFRTYFKDKLNGGRVVTPKEEPLQGNSTELWVECNQRKKTG